MSREATATTRTDRYDDFIRRVEEAEEAGAISAATADEMRSLVDAIPKLVQITRGYICDACGQALAAGADADREGFGATVDDLHEFAAMLAQAAALAADRGEDGESDVSVPALAEKYGLDTLDDYGGDDFGTTPEIVYPLDKVSGTIYGLPETGTDKVKLQLPAKSHKDKKHAEVNLICEIDYSMITDPHVQKRLTPYTKEVYTAVCSLWYRHHDAHGEDVQTIGQIYREMGYEGKPGKTDRDKIDKALTMMRTQITIDNSQEIAAKYKYPNLQIQQNSVDDAMLYFQRRKVKVNGQEAEAIKVYREPALLKFSRERNQLTTLPQQINRLTVSRTNKQLAIKDYLITRISKAKRAKHTEEVITYQAIYNAAHADTPKTKRTARETTKQLLDGFVQAGFVSGYETDPKKRHYICRTGEENRAQVGRKIGHR